MLRATLSLAIAAAFAGTISGHAVAQQLTGQLQAIASSKTLRIAYRTDAAPFSFVNDKQVVTGYTIDLCKLVASSIAKQLGLPELNIQWIPVSAQNRFSAVEGGLADMECGASSVTLTRMKQVDFSSLIYIESTGVAVRSESAAQKLSDLAGKKVAVITGTSNEKAVVAANEQFKLNLELVHVGDRDAGVATLQAGNADAFANDKMLLIGLQFKYPQSLRLLPDDLSSEYYAIVLPRGDWAMRLAVNTALARLFRNNDVSRVFDRWFKPIGLQAGLLVNTMYILGAVPE
jgi:ABC-type amino acid transport substrate-binding protein